MSRPYCRFARDPVAKRPNMRTLQKLISDLTPPCTDPDAVMAHYTRCVVGAKTEVPTKSTHYAPPARCDFDESIDPKKMKTTTRFYDQSGRAICTNGSTRPSCMNLLNQLVTAWEYPLPTLAGIDYRRDGRCWRSEMNVIGQQLRGSPKRPKDESSHRRLEPGSGKVYTPIGQPMKVLEYDSVDDLDLDGCPKKMNTIGQPLKPFPESIIHEFFPSLYCFVGSED